MTDVATKYLYTDVSRHIDSIPTNDVMHAIWKAYCDYCYTEFDDTVQPYYTDLQILCEFNKGLGIAYTTTGDGEHDLQVTMYPNSKDVTYEVDGIVVETSHYITEMNMIEDVFCDTYVGGDVFDTQIAMCEEFGRMQGIIKED